MKNAILLLFLGAVLCLNGAAQRKTEIVILITLDGARISEARNIWLAVVSPDANLRGEWTNAQTVHQNQIAATICKFLGFDYAEQNKNAGKAIAEVFSK